MKIRPHDLGDEGLPNGDYSVHIEDGVVSWGTASSPIDDALVAESTDGDFSFVFDDEGNLIYTED